MARSRIFWVSDVSREAEDMASHLTADYGHADRADELASKLEQTVNDWFDARDAEVKPDVR